jgi:hypothetical protein
LLRFFEVPLFDWVIAGIATYLSVHQNRFIPYASIFGFPIAMRSWYALLEQNGAGLHHALSKSRIFKAASLLLIGAAIVVFVKRGFLLSDTQSQPLGWGYGSRHPEQEVDYIKQQGLQGVLYNERMPDGAYLIRELYPQVRPVMDMRLDVYGKELCDEYDATKSNRDALNQYIQKYGATLALVNKGGWIEDHLRRALGFSTVYEGAERSVMVKRW